MSDERFELAENDVHVWHVPLDGEPNESTLSADERERADKFRFEADRRDFIWARSALRRRLATYGAGHAAEIVFSYSAAGKPHLAYLPHLQFNLAHTRGMAVIALTQGRRIGVDVERVREFPNAQEIVDLYFAAEEKAAYQRLEETDKRLGFFRAWTRKEAYVKAVGTGMGTPLDSFAVNLSPGEPAGFVRDSEAGWTLRDVSVGIEFISAVVIEGNAAFAVSVFSPNAP